MSITTFQDLRVWQNAHQLVLGVYLLTKKLPKEENYCLVSQIRRSAISVCANIAEGFRKGRVEFHRFLCIAQASLEETKYHLILCKDLKYCSSGEFYELFENAEDVGRMLNGLMKTLK